MSSSTTISNPQAEAPLAPAAGKVRHGRRRFRHYLRQYYDVRAQYIEVKVPDHQLSAGKRRYFWGHGPRAIVRRGYYQLIQQARLQGLNWRCVQTPREIATGLTALLPEDAHSVTEVTADYHQARYGPQVPARGLVKTFERLRRFLQKQLRSLTH